MRYNDPNKHHVNTFTGTLLTQYSARQTDSDSTLLD